MGLIGIAIKSGLVYTTVYATRHYNVWGDSKSTTELYEKLKHKADPHLKSVKSQIPFEIPLLPSSGELCFLTNHYYNCGVKSTIRFIHMLPCYVGRWAKKGKDAITQALDAPPPATKQ